MNTNWILHYYAGTSDKVYIVSILEQPVGYNVVATWGRRGKPFRQMLKGTSLTFVESRVFAVALVAEKLKEGYKNIEEPWYKGPLRIDDVKEHLAPDLEGTGDDEIPEHKIPEKEVPKKLPFMPSDITKSRSAVVPIPIILVRCSDNIGLESVFAVDEVCEAKTHKESDMIWVTDRNGDTKEYFKNRFEVVS